MRWIIICVMLTLAVPAWAAKKKSNVAQPKPQPEAQQTQPAESNLWNQKMCPNEIDDWKVLVTLNPYDSEGRCFNYVGRLVQLLNKNQALFSLLSDSAPFALINFGKGSVPIGPFYGVVKGKGAFSYETVSGSQKIIFSFVAIPKSKEREAWEKKRALEIVKKEERELAEKRTEAEQDWKKKIERLKKSELIASPFLYTDPSTGLMWPRNGNIAEKSMEWNKAIEWVIKLEYAGYSDWRIPTKTEFNSVANYILKDDVVFNEQVSWRGYLSSTNYKNDSDLFWTFNLKSGAWQAIGPISDGYLWPVRGGNVTDVRK